MIASVGSTMVGVVTSFEANVAGGVEDGSSHGGLLSVGAGAPGLTWGPYRQPGCSSSSAASTPNQNGPGDVVGMRQR